MRLGDMAVHGRWPGKMLKALAVIADTMHQTYDQQPEAKPGWSKQTCVFTTMCIRDFLVAIGYGDATGHPVTVLMHARRGDAVLHSLGIGVPGERDLPDKFNGHLVCLVPSLSLMIDATLYQAQRPQWGGVLPGMMVSDYFMGSDRRDPMYGLMPINAASVVLPDRTFDIMWLDRPDIRWKRDKDFRRNARRRAVTAAMVEKFGVWSD